MLKQEILKYKYSTPVSQTIDSPIMMLDYWELSDVFSALMVILIFGVIFYSWGIMMSLLLIILGLGPMIKRKYPKGIFLHWPYVKLKMSLPGLINPKSTNTIYSD